MSEYIRKEFPKSVGRDEFWKQIKRTINGAQVCKDQVEFIYKNI